MISYGKQSITEEDISAVVDVLRSDYLTQGPKVQEFERALAEYCDVKYCVAVSNGTAALHLAVLALNLPKGSEGITSTNTFVASANAMVYSGLVPKFADIDPETYNVTAKTLKDRLSERTSLFIPVHFAGQPCDMVAISNMVKLSNAKIIEDAAHAIGSCYSDGSSVGNCKYSEMTTFSFHPVKTITTGEGGAITTNNEVLYNRLLVLRNHGITKQPEMLSKNPGPWYYEMQALGYNYRMNDIQAVLGISQLNRLDDFKQIRKKIVDYYNSSFKDIEGIEIPIERFGVDSCFHLYVLRIDFDKIGISRTDFMKKLYATGIGTQVHYIPVHTQPFYKNKFGTKDADCINALAYYNNTISLPLFPDLSADDQQSVIEQVKFLCGECK